MTVSRSCLIAMLAVGLCLQSTRAWGQLPNLKNLFERGGYGGGGASATQDQLVREYVAANKDVLTAQAKLAAAVGLKDEAAKAQATADALSSGATKDNLSDADKIQGDTAKAIEAKLKENPQLDDQAKATYASGLGSLGEGLLKYGIAATTLKTFSSQVWSVNPVLLTRLGPAIYIASTLPINVNNLNTSLSTALNFAKSRDIPVPADATKALSAI